jgi:hypothetical protein
MKARRFLSKKIRKNFKKIRRNFFDLFLNNLTPQHLNTSTPSEGLRLFLAEQHSTLKTQNSKLKTQHSKLFLQFITFNYDFKLKPNYNRKNVL